MWRGAAAPGRKMLLFFAAEPQKTATSFRIWSEAADFAGYCWQTFARGDCRGLRPLPRKDVGARFGGSAAETSTNISFFWAAQPPWLISAL
jgi:hypothetical protein